MSEKNMNDKHKSIIHPYIPAQVSCVEAWLKNQAENGWTLISVNGWKFVFVRCQPHNSEYFMYSGFGNSIGWAYGYHRAKQTYAKRKELLNKTPSIIFKADTSRIDEHFFKYRRSRNQFYRKHYVCLALFSALFMALCGIICFWEPRVLYFLVAWLISFVYAAVSVIIIKQAK